MAANKTLTVCIILPAFNESAVIKAVLKDLPSKVTICGKKVQFQSIVIDDGSTDSTAKLAAAVPRVRVIRHLINMGAGAATRTGLHYARDKKFNLAVTMDADGQHSVSDLMNLIEVMLDQPTIDLLVGGRLGNRSGMPTHKHIGNRLLSYSTFALFGAYVSDSQSGFRVFSQKALHELSFNSNGYVFCSEMLWQAKRAHLRVSEHPVQAIYTDYSKAKGQKSYSGGMKILQQLLMRRILDLMA